MICVLDACAMIALLRKKAGEAVVAHHLVDPHTIQLSARHTPHRYRPRGELPAAHESQVDRLR